MMKSGAMKWVGLASWLITALASIHMGLKPFGYDVLANPSMQSLVTPIHYLVLAAGILSLIMFFMACTGGCGPCETK